MPGRDWENDESPEFCKRHKIDYWGSCPECPSLLSEEELAREALE